MNCKLTVTPRREPENPGEHTLWVLMSFPGGCHHIYFPADAQASRNDDRIDLALLKDRL
jgi:hypothetical protein